MSRVRITGLLLLAATLATPGPVDRTVLQLGNWLVGSFDNRAQAESDREAGAPFAHESLVVSGRALEDPVAFVDGLYVYVEARLEGQAQPFRQRVYRLKKAGSRVRLESFQLSAHVLAPLAAEPQMLGNLAPGDLTKEAGCDVILELKQEAYLGVRNSRECKGDFKDPGYVTTSLRVTKDTIVVLERGYDERGVQMFGPTDGRGHELRRRPAISHQK